MPCHRYSTHSFKQIVRCLVSDCEALAAAFCRRKKESVDDNRFGRKNDVCRFLILIHTDGRCSVRQKSDRIGILVCKSSVLDI